ncbi:hypothetical protein GCM10010255_39410 [Streptomyces coeruleofuscus]|uniref:Uncharacterized protein n=1 Tax=Streptomyces coeruleofuscus TaxID=66879 RepID=A0ABN3IF55_9ACTN
MDRSWLIHDAYSGADGAEEAKGADGTEIGDLGSASVPRISGELVWTTMSSHPPSREPVTGFGMRQLGCVRNDNRT